MTFQHNIPYMINSFIFSLDIPVVIYILYEMIEILREKMLKAIYLYWFPNDTLAENNALNGHSSKRQTTNSWAKLITWIKKSRNSRSQVFDNISILKNNAKFTLKHLC